MHTLKAKFSLVKMGKGGEFSKLNLYQLCFEDSSSSHKVTLAKDISYSGPWPRSFSLLWSIFKKKYTANIYRDLWGFYRELGVQGFHIYRVSLGIKLPVIVTVILQKIHREC